MLDNSRSNSPNRPNRNAPRQARFPAWICARVLAGALILAAFFVAVPGLGAAQEADPGQPAGAEQGRALVIGPEDGLTIVMLDSEELSKVWRVGATGELDLPMVGRMQVAGMTVEQFESELTGKLRRYFKDPQVTVFISDFRSQPVTVTGAVEKPGTSQLEGPRTLFEVIMRAGGPKDAGPAVTLTRAIARGAIPWPGAKTDSDGYSVATFNLQDVIDGHSAAANIAVQPYDVVSVQEGKEQKLVHIIGEVNRPGAVELVSQNSVSLLRMVAVAGGLTRSAGSKVRILHIGPEGSRTTPAVVDLKMILDGKAQDLELTAGDVVMVPPGHVLRTTGQTLAMTAFSAGIWTILATL